MTTATVTARELDHVIAATVTDDGTAIVLMKTDPGHWPRSHRYILRQQWAKPTGEPWDLIRGTGWVTHYPEGDLARADADFRRLTGIEAGEPTTLDTPVPATACRLP